MNNPTNDVVEPVTMENMQEKPHWNKTQDDEGNNDQT